MRAVMARKAERNGHLEQAIALLIQNQAAFVADMRENSKQFTEIRRDFEKIQGAFEEIKNILIRHEHILANLPEAIRERIGFKADHR